MSKRPHIPHPTSSNTTHETNSAFSGLNPQNFGLNLTAAIREHPYWGQPGNQAELCEKVGVRATHIKEIKQGSRIPSLRQAVEMSNILGASLDDLVGLRQVNQRNGLSHITAMQNAIFETMHDARRLGDIHDRLFHEVILSLSSKWSTDADNEVAKLTTPAPQITFEDIAKQRFESGGDLEEQDIHTQLRETLLTVRTGHSVSDRIFNQKVQQVIHVIKRAAITESNKIAQVGFSNRNCISASIAREMEAYAKTVSVASRQLRYNHESLNNTARFFDAVNVEVLLNQGSYRFLCTGDLAELIPQVEKWRAYLKQQCRVASHWTKRSRFNFLVKCTNKFPIIEFAYYDLDIVKLEREAPHLYGTAHANGWLHERDGKWFMGYFMQPSSYWTAFWIINRDELIGVQEVFDLLWKNTENKLCHE